MNELVQMIMQKTGLSQDQAQEVVNTVVTYLKGRLPAALTSHLDAFLGGSGQGGASASMASEAESIVAGLGNMFAKKTE